ncbi:amine oxidase [Colletotrichum acutatum]
MSALFVFGLRHPDPRQQQGGHIDSFTNPQTGKVFDCGVNVRRVRRGSRGLDVLQCARSEPGSSTPRVHIRQFQGPITHTSLPVSMEIASTFEKQLEICEMYESATSPAYTNFPETTSETPKDLTLSFSNFVEEYSLDAAVPRIFQVTDVGMGNLANQTTLSLLSFPFLNGSRISPTPWPGRGDIFLTAAGVRIIRTAVGVEASVQNTDGEMTVIRAEGLS